MSASTDWHLEVHDNKRRAKLIDTETGQSITFYGGDIPELRDLLDKAEEDLGKD